MKITEQTAVIFKDHRINKDDRVLYGVSILHKVAQGGRRIYEEQALRDVAELSEGKKSFLNHREDIPSHARKADEVIGSFFSTQFENDDRVRGNFRYVPSREKLFEDLLSIDTLGVGFSIHADGNVTYGKGGVQTVHSIQELYSIDLVSSTGSTLSLFESGESAGRLKEAKEPTDADLLSVLADEGVISDRAARATIDRISKGETRGKAQAFLDDYFEDNSEKSDSDDDFVDAVRREKE